MIIIRLLLSDVLVRNALAHERAQIATLLLAILREARSVTVFSGKRSFKTEQSAFFLENRKTLHARFHYGRQLLILAWRHASSRQASDADRTGKLCRFYKEAIAFTSCLRGQTYLRKRVSEMLLYVLFHAHLSASAV